MNETSRAIITALLKLANSGTFSCDLEGANAMAQLTRAATNHVAELTEVIDSPQVDQLEIENRVTREIMNAGEDNDTD